MPLLDAASPAATLLRVSVPGGALAALDAGPRSGPLALCLHGFPDHAPSFLPLQTHLAGAGLRVVAPWMRGYHPSTLVGPYDVDRLAGDVLALADTLSPDAPVCLIGHDWGAVAATWAAALAPHRVAHLVTLSVPHPVSFLRHTLRDPQQLRRSGYMAFFQLRGLADAWVAANDLAFIDHLWARWSPGYRLPASNRAVLHACLRASLPAPLRYYRALGWPPGQALARLRRAARAPISVPTLHLHGAQDGCIGPGVGADSDTAGRASEARYFCGPFRREVVAGAGHFLPLEVPDLVAHRVLEWLGRTPA